MPVHEFKVEMSCSGCSGAVERVLKRIGVETVAIDLDKQQVLVTSDKNSDELLAVIQKTGKKTEFVGTH